MNTQAPSDDIPTPVNSLQARSGLAFGLRRWLSGHKPARSPEQKAVLRAVKHLQKVLEEKHHQAARLLSILPPEAREVQDLLCIVKMYNEVGVGLACLAAEEGARVDRGRACLQTLFERLTGELAGAPVERHLFRKHLSDLVGDLVLADQQIASAAPLPFPSAAPDSGRLRILVPTDLLYQMYSVLFPAERMLVVSGRRNSGEVVLGAAFDVTGTASAGHVSANPNLLGRALISMDLSGSHLAAWVHSHPGAGAQATCPSSIDLRQHADWLRDYSRSLLGAILVQDRHIRFWGTALEAGELSLDCRLPIQPQEDSNDHVYRLDS